jgi:hypothetical protein
VIKGRDAAKQLEKRFKVNSRLSGSSRNAFEGHIDITGLCAVSEEYFEDNAARTKKI